MGRTGLCQAEEDSSKLVGRAENQRFKTEFFC